jgi:hypothetical protein
VPTKSEARAERGEELLDALKRRFEANMVRHPGVAWDDVVARLEAHPEKLAALERMEATGGEPDVTGRDEATGEVVFVDCSRRARRAGGACASTPRRWRAQEEPARGQRGRDGARDRDRAADGGEYRALQELGEFDTTTSSWVATPPDIRRLGGALFCDRRYGAVFVYHNGADSYYGARGFRGSLRV